MEENLQNKDNWESFFKNSFDIQDNHPSENGWDIPADTVWDQIEEALPQPAPKPVIYLSRTARVIAASILFLLAGISLFLYFQNKDLQRIIQQQNKLAKETQYAPKKEVKQPRLINEGTSGFHEDGLANIEPSETYQKPSANNPNKLILKKTINNKRQTTFQKNKKEETVVPNADFAKLKQDHSQENTATATEQREDFAQIVAPVQTIANGIQQEQPAAINQFYLPSKSSLKVEHNRSKFFVGGFVTTNYSGKRVTPASNHSAPPFRGYEKSEITANWSAKLGYHLTDHWDLLTGISRINSRQIQKRRFLFNHDATQEQHNNQEYVSSYSLSISSSYGTSDAAVEVSRPNNMSLNDRMLPVNVTIKQKASQISIPLILKHRSKIGPLNFSIQGGVAVDILNKFETKLQVNSLRPMFHARPGRSIQNPNLKRKTSVDFIAGLGLSYDITPHLSLAIEPQIQKNIQPFVKNDEFKSSFYVSSVQLGAYWNF